VVQFETVQPDIHNRGGISIRDLFRAALRMRPDRIIVGECRGGEALDMIQAMNSGHAGSLSTVHADSPARALSRLETLCMMSDVEMPLAAIRRQLGEAIDIIVQVDRIGRDRRVTQIAKVVESDDMPTIETVEV
jgi:pilus assembly protein CpaF